MSRFSYHTKQVCKNVRCCTEFDSQLFIKCRTRPPFMQIRAQTKQNQSCPLTTRSLDLLWRTLSTLFARQSRLSLGSTCSTLCLLCLLCAGGLGTLVLALLDSSCACSGTGLGSLVSSLLDHIEGSTDNSTLRLDSTAGALLSNFL